MTRRPLRGAEADPFRRPAPGMADLRGRLLSGFRSPEGEVYAGAGTLYQDTDPGGTGQVYRKTTPGGNTGWVALGAGGGAAGFSWCHLATPGDMAWQGRSLGGRWYVPQLTDVDDSSGDGWALGILNPDGFSYAGVLPPTSGLYHADFLFLWSMPSAWVAEAGVSWAEFAEFAPTSLASAVYSERLSDPTAFGTDEVDEHTALWPGHLEWQVRWSMDFLSSGRYIGMGLNGGPKLYDDSAFAVGGGTVPWPSNPANGPRGWLSATIFKVG
jgi:hypothetical protein